MPTSSNDVHANEPLLTSGAPLKDALAAVLLVHGRGANAESMLSLYSEMALEGFAVLAPQAANRTWYPHSFLASIESNEPFLTSALHRLGQLIQEIEAVGIPAQRIALLGFSQGACLVSEFAARHPQPYGAVIAFTGGLIGPPATPRAYSGSLKNARIFLGSGDPDGHVPFARVQETADVFKQMGAEVSLRRYPGMPHSINEEELQVARDMLQRLATP